MLGQMWVAGYFVTGIIVAVATMYLFRPVQGYRPHIALVITAVAVYTLLWPVLVLLAAWYHWRMFVLNRRGKIEARTTSTRTTSKQEQPAISRLTTSKPR